MNREDIINQAAIKYTKGTNSYRDIVFQDTFMEGVKFADNNPNTSLEGLQRIFNSLNKNEQKEFIIWLDDNYMWED